MSAAYLDYVHHLDSLRKIRERSGPRGEEDPVLEEMDALWVELTDDERVAVDQLSWRAWPEEFRRRAPNAPRRDTNVWARRSRSPRMVLGAT